METRVRLKDQVITRSLDHPVQTQTRIQTQILIQILRHHPITRDLMTRNPMSLDRVLPYHWMIQMGISFQMTKSQTIILTNMIGTVIMTI
jgi:hypothetical protein